MSAGLLAGLLGVCSIGCEMSSSRSGKAPALTEARARVDARTTLQQAAVSNDAMTRAHAMEAISQVLGRSGGSLLLQGLTDRYVVVRYAAAMGLGDIRYEAAEGRLLEIVRNPQSDQRVVCAAIYGLSRLGNTEYANQLAALLHSDFALGRASAAEVMGKMSEPSAIGPIKSAYAQEEDPAAQVAMVEALARLGDTRSIRVLESFAKGYLLDLRLVAIPALAEIHAPRAGLILKRLQESDSPPRVRVAAAGALGKLGLANQQSYDLCRYGLGYPARVLQEAYGEGKVVSQHEADSLARLAAMGLGKIGKPQAVPALHRQLDNPNGGVRVAAAMAILKILAPPDFYQPERQAGPAPGGAKPRKGASLQRSGAME